MMIDLATLPPPNVVELLDYTTLYSEVQTQFRALYPQWSAVLESDPVTKLLELTAYRELLLRARINDAALSNLLAFATGTDLMGLAAFYNIEKMPGERDDRLRTRIQLKAASMAGNGLPEWYQTTAMAASLDVIDTAVQRPKPGAVELIIMVSAGADPAATQTAVEQVFALPGGLPGGLLSFNVRVATPVPVAVAGTVYRDATAPIDIVESLTANFPVVLAGYSKIGRGVGLSWIESKFQTAGVVRVDLTAPTQNIAIAADEYPVSGPVHLIDGGVL